jgi:hypothetical protein
MNQPLNRGHLRPQLARHKGQQANRNNKEEQAFAGTIHGRILKAGATGNKAENATGNFCHDFARRLS